MSTVTRPSALSCKDSSPFFTFTRTGLRSVSCFLVHVAHKTARAVAAVLDLAAVGVVDHVFKIQTLRRAKAAR